MDYRGPISRPGNGKGPELILVGLIIVLLGLVLGLGPGQASGPIMGLAIGPVLP